MLLPLSCKSQVHPFKHNSKFHVLLQPVGCSLATSGLKHSVSPLGMKSLYIACNHQTTKDRYTLPGICCCLFSMLYVLSGTRLLLLNLKLCVIGEAQMLDFQICGSTLNATSATGGTRPSPSGDSPSHHDSPSPSGDSPSLVGASPKDSSKLVFQALSFP